MTLDLPGLSFAVGLRDGAAELGVAAPDTVRDGVCACTFPRLMLGLFSTFGVAAVPFVAGWARWGRLGLLARGSAVELCLRFRVSFIDPPGVETGRGGGDMAVVGTCEGLGAAGGGT